MQKISQDKLTMTPKLLLCCYVKLAKEVLTSLVKSSLKYIAYLTLLFKVSLTESVLAETI